MSRTILASRRARDLISYSVAGRRIRLMPLTSFSHRLVWTASCFLTGGREAIIVRLAVIFRRACKGGHPAAILQPVERRVKRFSVPPAGSRSTVVQSSGRWNVRGAGPMISVCRMSMSSVPWSMSSSLFAFLGTIHCARYVNLVEALQQCDERLVTIGNGCASLSRWRGVGFLQQSK